MADPQNQTRGITAYDGPVSGLARLGAGSIDLSLALCTYSFCVYALHLSPLPGALGIALWIAGIGGAWVGTQHFLKLTPGEKLWGMGRPSLHLVQKKRLTGPTLVQALGSTFLMLFLAGYSSWNFVGQHPVLKKIELHQEAGLLNEENRPLPFYYLLLNWPLEFSGKPIFSSIPYEKGPPKKFPGRVIAHWQSPEIQLSIQGPITPENAPLRDGVRDCALENRSLACLSLRNQLLMPEISELRQSQGENAPTSSPHWKLQWLETSGISGFWLEHQTLKKTQIRVLLFNEKGTQQRLTLSYPTGTLHGTQARSLFVGILKSASFFEDLKKSRVGIQGELAKVRLVDVEKNSSQSAFPKQIASIQALLISKITVDPADFDAYFHLAGTAALLRRNVGIEVLEITQPLIEAMSKYAQDIAPQDSRTAQIKNLLKN